MSTSDGGYGCAMVVCGWVCVVGLSWLLVIFEFWAWWLMVVWWLAMLRIIGLKKRKTEERETGRERKNKK